MGETSHPGHWHHHLHARGFGQDTRPFWAVNVAEPGRAHAPLRGSDRMASCVGALLTCGTRLVNLDLAAGPLETAWGASEHGAVPT